VDVALHCNPQSFKIALLEKNDGALNSLFCSHSWVIDSARAYANDRVLAHVTCKVCRCAMLTVVSARGLDDGSLSKQFGEKQV
jgi:hypothetical protein